MKSCVFALLMVVCSFELQAASVLVGNPYTPYPPGCATLPDLQAALYGGNRAKVFDGRVSLNTTSRPREVRDVNLAVYRVACAEPNRSIIWLEFSIPEGVDPHTVYEIPNIMAELDHDPSHRVRVELVREPNIWGVGIAPSYFVRPAQTFGNPEENTESDHDKRWIFVIDGYQNASQYNERFTLELEDSGSGTVYRIEIPATASSLIANPRIPLNGRLSGNWVMEGIPDQGLLISISEQADDQSGAEAPDPLDFRLLMFLSWYTYDADGELLWLTGAAEFALGATEVAVPIELVTHGQFFGSKTADREVVGSVTITGNNCNDLGFQYDLEDIGLGSGTQNLQRLFSLETAGYVCRDLEARVLENGK
jgi:hypothetical protein